MHTNFLPRSISMQMSLNELLRMAPEDIASQLTLSDLPVFKLLTREEFLTLAWNTSRKVQLTPNIVAFSRKFNKISFWVIDEILLADRKARGNGENASKQSRSGDMDGAKCRAEVVMHFIKVSKRLFELNNIHSCYAIISALNSSSIYRLTKTWHLIGKKEKAIFDKLSSILNDENNFELLRNHLNSIKGQGIPYLGMFLRDLVYTDIAHPVSPGLHNSQREMKINKILDVIMNFVITVNYDLTSVPYVMNYLNSINYIEELQKFLEEDNFKLSQKLEPPEPKSSTSLKNCSQSIFYVKHLGDNLCSSRKSNSECFAAHTYSNASLHIKCCSESKMHDSLSMPCCTPEHQEERPFVPSHRKTKSLGAGAILHSHVTPKPSCMELKGRYLIDDSVIEDDVGICMKSSSSLSKFSRGSVNYGYGTMDDEGFTDGSDREENEMMKPVVEFDDESYGDSLPLIAYQGYVRRKTILKDGKKPALSAWVRYWLTLRGTMLLYYPSKSFRGTCRSDFKTSPTKCVCLKKGWIAIKLEDDPQSVDCFTLSDPTGKNVYKFKTNTHLEAVSWCREINHAYNECLIKS